MHYKNIIQVEMAFNGGDFVLPDRKRILNELNSISECVKYFYHPFDSMN